MFEVIPSVNETEWPVVKQQIESIAPVTDWLELDIGDGKFTSVKTWANPTDLGSLSLTHPVKFAAHLMVYNPEQYIDGWIKAGVRRIIIQWEAITPRGLKRLMLKSDLGKRLQAIARQCKESWVEFGVSLAPQTPPSRLQKYLYLFDIVQILAGTPGPAHQEFDMASLERMGSLVQMRQIENLSFKTEWDIGVNPDTIEQIKKSGTDIAASTSFVFNSTEPVRTLEYLRNKARGLI